MKSRQKGFSIIEAVLSIASVAIIGITFFPSISNLTSRSKRSIYESQASRLLGEEIEVVYNIFLSDWQGSVINYPEGQPYHPSIDSSGPNPVWTLEPGEQAGIETRFDRKVEVLGVCRDASNGVIKACADGGIGDENSKLIKAEIKWKDSGNEKTSKTQLLITNLERI
ncbi:MAG: hypothetical protein UX87_C0019G0003 [Candidatus Amesbacteria bacterium GW2011_GWA1_47_16]|uniref:Uncharacterized protein n=4 Tax=Candidatus Amesiibacteriota TaxID=1752730 RepID=A0A1F4ZXX5_9BACT|nr:MAG: hypothetical protein UX86_C0030G0014 [Candidatus Amesbacteria bacterium GW2011_GWC1_47_15]KKU63636.1 MAG: hypothetical protein UX87_C0019G0003 [Candidatus Amesbacteria bacterium GW2011_GWA1_47_16]KKU97460.1 MAG: hypothetical protein UY28_C0020G0004 [Candidatus Amesbacteria bacterium GW2011_GWB1_48_13]OGC98106.1 MAG: hypothetical protein A2701_01620 [Candidatus Amesbacteria bacterium RIFCSPHIGHO2_01_FULL_47_34]OGD11242.1 MAG: hypothetical protein A2395_04445 [Candidatus Amesbacteria bact